MSSNADIPLSPVSAPTPRRLPSWLITLGSNTPLLLLLLLVPMGRWIENEQHVDRYHARVIMLIGINITLAVSLQLINGISGQFSLGHAGFMAIGAYIAGYATKTYGQRLEAPPSVLLFFLSLVLVGAAAAAVIAVLVALLRSTGRAAKDLPMILGVLVVVWIVVDLIAWEKGATRWTCWARVLRFLIDWFSAMSTHGERPLTLLLAIVGGGVAAGLVGLLVGLPTLRLRGDYLAIATLGFATIIQTLLTTSKTLGAATGLQLDPYSYFPRKEDIEPGSLGDSLFAWVYRWTPQPGEPPEHLYTIFPWVYGTAIITILVVWRLTHAAKGRAIRAVRDDEIAASAIGIDVTHYKIVAFVIGAFFAGCAGAIYAHYEGYLNPNQFGLTKSVELVVIVTLGGLGNIWGAIIAAVILTFLPEFLRDPGPWLALPLRPLGVKELNLPPWLLELFATVGKNRMIFYSLLLITLMLLRGKDYLGTVRRMWKRKAGAGIDMLPAVQSPSASSSEEL